MGQGLKILRKARNGFDIPPDTVNLSGVTITDTAFLSDDYRRRMKAYRDSLKLHNLSNSWNSFKLPETERYAKSLDDWMAMEFIRDFNRYIREKDPERKKYYRKRIKTISLNIEGSDKSMGINPIKNRTGWYTGPNYIGNDVTDDELYRINDSIVNKYNIPNFRHYDEYNDEEFYDKYLKPAWKKESKLRREHDNARRRKMDDYMYRDDNYSDDLIHPKVNPNPNISPISFKEVYRGEAGTYYLPQYRMPTKPTPRYRSPKKMEFIDFNKKGKPQISERDNEFKVSVGGHEIYFHYSPGGRNNYINWGEGQGIEPLTNKQAEALYKEWNDAGVLKILGNTGQSNVTGRAKFKEGGEVKKKKGRNLHVIAEAPIRYNYDKVINELLKINYPDQFKDFDFEKYMSDQQKRFLERRAVEDSIREIVGNRWGDIHWDEYTRRVYEIDEKYKTEESKLYNRYKRKLDNRVFHDFLKKEGGEKGLKNYPDIFYRADEFIQESEKLKNNPFVRSAYDTVFITPTHKNSATIDSIGQSFNKGDDLVIMGHRGGDLLGIPVDDLNLTGFWGKPGLCVLGSCEGGGSSRNPTLNTNALKIAHKLDAPVYSTKSGNKWWGVNPKGKNMLETFFTVTRDSVSSKPDNFKRYSLPFKQTKYYDNYVPYPTSERLQDGGEITSSDTTKNKPLPPFLTPIILYDSDEKLVNWKYIFNNPEFSSTKEFDHVKKWMVDWINKRTTQKLGLEDEFISDAKKNILETPIFNLTEITSAIPQRLKDKIKFELDPESYWGYYKSIVKVFPRLIESIDKIVVNDQLINQYPGNLKNSESTAVHELGHASGLAESINHGIINEIIANDPIRQKNYKKRGLVGFDDYYDYYYDPDEIYSRIWEIRFNHGLKPDQKVDDNLINEIYEKERKRVEETPGGNVYKNEIFKQFKPQTIKKLLNDLVMTEDIKVRMQDGGDILPADKTRRSRTLIPYGGKLNIGYTPPEYIPTNQGYIGLSSRDITNPNAMLPQLHMTSGEYTDTYDNAFVALASLGNVPKAIPKIGNFISKSKPGQIIKGIKGMRSTLKEGKKALTGKTKSESIEGFKKMVRDVISSNKDDVNPSNIMGIAKYLRDLRPKGYDFNKMEDIHKYISSKELRSDLWWLSDDDFIAFKNFMTSKKIAQALAESDDLVKKENFLMYLIKKRGGTSSSYDPKIRNFMNELYRHHVATAKNPEPFIYPWEWTDRWRLNSVLPLLPVGAKQTNDVEMKKGGVVYPTKLKKEGVLKIVPIHGPSHKEGGVPMVLNGLPVEAEGGEFLLDMKDGSKIVLNKKQMKKINMGEALSKVRKGLPKFKAERGVDIDPSQINWYRERHPELFYDDGRLNTYLYSQWKDPNDPRGYFRNRFPVNDYPNMNRRFEKDYRYIDQSTIASAAPLYARTVGEPSGALAILSTPPEEVNIVAKNGRTNHPMIRSQGVSYNPQGITSISPQRRTGNVDLFGEINVGDLAYDLPMDEENYVDDIPLDIKNIAFMAQNPNFASEENVDDIPWDTGELAGKDPMKVKLSLDSSSPKLAYSVTNKEVKGSPTLKQNYFFDPSMIDSFVSEYQKNLGKAYKTGQIPLAAQLISSLGALGSNANQYYKDRVSPITFSPQPVQKVSAATAIEEINKTFNNAIEMARKTGKPEMITSLVAQKNEAIRKATADANKLNAQIIAAADRSNAGLRYRTDAINAQIADRNLMRRDAFEQFKTHVDAENRANISQLLSMYPNFAGERNQNMLMSDIMGYLAKTGQFQSLMAGIG